MTALSKRILEDKRKVIFLLNTRETIVVRVVIQCFFLKIILDDEEIIKDSTVQWVFMPCTPLPFPYLKFLEEFRCS